MEERIEGNQGRKRFARGIACFAVLFLLCCLLFRNNKSSTLYQSLRSSRTNTYKDASVHDLSNDFPSLEDSIEMARLSRLVYAFKHYYDDCNATTSDGTPLLPTDLNCHLYNHNHATGTQVMILTSTQKQYIAICFAGTDDLRTTLVDTDILMKPFGPLDKDGESILLPGPARVHAGFDNQVFEESLFEQVRNITTNLLSSSHKNYRLFTTGHSLGGADAILTAVALVQSKLAHVKRITCISFGCPNTGNEEWRNAVHSLNSTSIQLSIWRFVHGWDVVPRLPEYPFTHVGHTLQMNNNNGMHAYYLHRGNFSLHYASVPLGWSGMLLLQCIFILCKHLSHTFFSFIRFLYSAKPFIFLPGALWSHVIRKYQQYLENQSAVDPDLFYVNSFEAINTTNNDDDDGMIDDDAWINPPDDEIYQDEEEGILTLDEDALVMVRNENIVVVDGEVLADVQ